MLTENIIISALTIVPASIGAIAAVMSARHSKQANDAVNHRHITGTPRLYDLALENHQKVDELVGWKRGYDESPWNNGSGVEEWLKEHDDTHAAIIKRIEELEKKDYS